MSTPEFLDLDAELTEDVRGVSLFPLKGRSRNPKEALASFHLISILPGQTRGNHVHPGHREWLYPFHGTGWFRWQKEGSKVEERLIAGGRIMIRIPAGVAHALTNPGPEVLYLLAWRESEDKAAAGPETVAHPLS